jgi:hypothetical protein
MKLRHTVFVVFTAFLLLGSMQAKAAIVSISLGLLTGETPQDTGVFKAQLNGLGLTDLASITITDDPNSAGSPGIWSGFDLVGIKLSSTNCTSATCADGLTGLSVFDFVNDVSFTSGTLDPTAGVLDPTSKCQAGTSGVGCAFDNSIATLDDFDAAFDGTTGVNSGFLSMGRGGKISFDLTLLVSLSSDLFLYIGEAGNNGEALEGSVVISDLPAVPVPAAVWLFGTALIGLVGFSKRRKAA